LSLPVLTPESNLSPQYALFINALKVSDFSGDIESSYSARLVHATDNSVYYQLPQAIIYPKDNKDCQIIGEIGQQYPSVAFSARGGGTGTNGQSLTEGIVVDIRRYLNHVLEINVEEKWVRVQTGIVKDQLNDILRPFGLFFSPDLSTSNRATLGGMINTDASGQGSLVYGKTSDHLLGLTAVLANGELIETKPLPIDEARQKAKGVSQESQIYQQVLASCVGHRDAILAKFPPLNRFLTGYDLAHAHDDGHIDIGRLLAGSEGSLAFITEATLSLDDIAQYKALINITYRSFDDALRHAPQLVKARATSVETIDSTVLNFAKTDIVWHDIHDLIADVPESELLGLNLVEYNANSETEMSAHIQQFEATIKQSIASGEGGISGYAITYSKADIQRIYAMRKKAVGLLGKSKGNKKPIAFVEDTAVPPEHLADYIQEFRALLDNHGLAYGMFGHVDAGVLHVRPALDLSDPAQEMLMHKISDEVVALVAKYGGLMWGEHGKGFRSEYGPAFFGEVLFEEMRKIKAAFDPHNQMNPGKICTPFNSDAKLVSVKDKKRASVERVIPIEVKAAVAPAFECNGNGLCFNYDPTSPMCPSSKVTQDRRHSPKGRASMLREWVRLVVATSPQTLDKTTLTAHAFKTPLWKKCIYTWFGSKEDFSHEVKEVMDGCLACKSCTHQCPVNIDVPDFRTTFLSIYHQRYLRPLKDFLVSNVERIAPLAASVPALHNTIMGSALIKRVMQSTIGYVDMPLLSSPTLVQRTAGVVEPFDLQALSNMNANEQRQRVVIVQDPFTSFYDAQCVEHLVSVIVKVGLIPVLMPFTPNGKPAHVKGFLDKFKEQAKNMVAQLNAIHKLGITMVGADASLVLCFRDEYVKTLGEKRGDFHVHTIDEWLNELPEFENIARTALNTTSRPYTLMAHCSEKTALPQASARWVSIFEKLGASLLPRASGCCGMAGTFGHEVSNLDASRSLFDMSWSSAFEDQQKSEVLVTGFSCRSQVARFQGTKPKHPIHVIDEILK
jgi:FAD/FMN-containing dehydrogenase/Fe-S oxidoreductase